MLRELWTEHRKAFLFAVGMACFLAAGLLGRFVPDSPDSPNAADSPQNPPAAEAPVQTEPPQAEISQPAPGARVVRSSAGRTSGVSVLQLSAEPEAEEWILYITGEVQKPGVYRLPAGARLFRLVEEAGGLSRLADPAAVNLASMLADGTHVHVPARERQAYAAPPALRYEAPGSAQPSRASRSPSRASAAQNGMTGVVDVNRASPEELTALKGIGPALARNIVEYRRKNGQFRSAEDLLQVKGIGEKKLEGFRDFITVGR